MKLLLIYFVLFLCCCHTTIHQEPIVITEQKDDADIIELHWKGVNGICYPDYMEESEVLLYAEALRKDEGDSVRYRLGVINDWKCKSSDRVTCDTLYLFVFKLVPFFHVNKLVMKFGSDAWQIEKRLDYYKVNGGNLFLKGTYNRGDWTYFGRNHVCSYPINN
jgi:hypothetical protein